MRIELLARQITGGFMLGFVPTVANLVRTPSLHRPEQIVPFPSDAYGFWEGQGQSNMTGFNQISDAPAALRVMNARIEMMTAAPGWRPYGLLADGESADVEGVIFTGKYDEADIPAAAGGAGPLIGLHEAMLNGAMSGPQGLLAAGLFLGKFADAGKPLTAFLPAFDDGTAPLGGVNFNARNNVLPGLLRARIAAGDRIFHQGKVWLQGETNAAEARAAGNTAHPALTGYAEGLAGIRAFDRAQFGLPDAPWYMVAIAEQDQYAAAVNDALASLCRWHVGPGGNVADLGAGRDATSYIIDHMILPVGDVHFTMTQMRAIGALVWEAHRHLAGHSHGLTDQRPILQILPVWQAAPRVVASGSQSVSVEAVSNEAGILHLLALPSGSTPPDLATVKDEGVQSAGQRGRVVRVDLTGLNAATAYDLWVGYAIATGEATPLVRLEAMTATPAVASGWTPAEAGVRAWWDAQASASITQAAGAVTGWADLSGRAVTLAAAEPSRRPVLNPAGINGMPALDFNGQAELQGTGVGLAADMCLLMVAQVDLVTNGSQSLIDFQTQNLAIRAQHSAEFRARFELMNGTNTNVSPVPVTDYSGAPHIFVSRYDSAADLVEVWIDGILTASQATYLTDIAASDNIRIMRPFDAALWLAGKVGEVAVIASSAAADRERLEGYAAHRWGLAESLPAGHAWRANAP
jgi:hypothetical protein